MTAIRVWLWIVAAMIFAMVIVGGATRLTESGLSITQWNLVSGIVPPWTDAAWQAAFDRYKAIPQYAQMAPDMDMAGFKAIFWWEWAHRLLGRLIGVVVAVPLAVFWFRGTLPRDLKFKLLGLLALGGLQGAIGWWMVKSGLSERTEVSQYRLALHLLTASVTLALTVWLALGLPPERALPATGRAGPRLGASLLLVGVFVQLGLGALVAGLRAGRVYDTWPLMGDRLVPSPSELMAVQPLWRNPFENPVTAQFDHRLMAYLLLAGAVVHAWRCRGTPAARMAALLLAAVVGQAAIGIVTLVWGVPLAAALAHQGAAMLVLVLAVVHRSGLRRHPRRRAVPMADPSREIIGLPAFAGGSGLAR